MRTFVFSMIEPKKNLAQHVYRGMFMPPIEWFKAKFKVDILNFALFYYNPVRDYIDVALAKGERDPFTGAKLPNRCDLIVAVFEDDDENALHHDRTPSVGQDELVAATGCSDGEPRFDS